MPARIPPAPPCDVAYARPVDVALRVRLPVAFVTVPAPTAVSTVGVMTATALPPLMPMPSAMFPTL